MLFLDGVYLNGNADTPPRFHWVKAPTSNELTQLTHRMAERVGRLLERQGLLERDTQNSYLASDAVDDDPLHHLLGHSIDNPRRSAGRQPRQRSPSTPVVARERRCLAGTFPVLPGRAAVTRTVS